MKNLKNSKVKTVKADDLAEHYDLDYALAKPNRFAKLKKDQMVVVLDKDITSFFHTPKEVLNALRSVIHAFPAKNGNRSRL